MRNHTFSTALAPLIPLTLWGCATTPELRAPEYFFYPPPPDAPRIQFLTSISGEQDFVVQRNSFADFVIGKKKETRRQLHKPYGLAIRNGVIYVCDTRINRIGVLDLQGEKIDFIAGSVVGAAGNAGLAAVVPVLTGNAFNAMLKPSPDTSVLSPLALIIGVSLIIRGALQLGRNFGAELLAQKLERQVRDELYLALLGKSMTFHNLQPVGDTMARSTNDEREVNYMFSPGVNLVVGSFVFILMPIYVAGRYHPTLIITPLVFIVLYFFFLSRYLKTLAPITDEVPPSCATSRDWPTPPAWPIPRASTGATSSPIWAPLPTTSIGPKPPFGPSWTGYSASPCQRPSPRSPSPISLAISPWTGGQNARQAWYMNFYELAGVGQEFLDRYTAQVKAVSAADVQRAARQYLATLRTVIVRPPAR